MNKANIAIEVAKQANKIFPADSPIKNCDVHVVLECYHKLILKELVSNDEFLIHDIGRLQVVVRKARVGRNLWTDEPVDIPTRKRVCFREFKELKAKLAESLKNEAKS